MVSAEPIVRVEDLSVHYTSGGRLFTRQRTVVRAVDGVTLDVFAGETVALVGESGSGKSTLGRAILRRVDPAEGSIYFRGKDITTTTGEPLRRLRQDMQMVFQDPFGSVNPRKRVLDIVAEPLVVHGVVRRTRDARERVTELLAMTGMPPDAVDCYPHAFSGGQLQRVGIARALALEPSFLVADEPVAALDTSIQAQVVNLLQDLQDRLGLTYLFISHDLAVVRHISNRIAIMYAGRLVEIAQSDAIFGAPKHPYTRSLLAAVPLPDPTSARRGDRLLVRGELNSNETPPDGCAFYGRCAFRQPGVCDVKVPELRRAGDRHDVACHFAEEIQAGVFQPSVDGSNAPLSPAVQERMQRGT